jgi:hypothetical protein
MKLNGINMKQTAVEWFVDLFKDEPRFLNEFSLDIKQAKEMEKQQAESIWKASQENMHRQFSSSAYKPITFEQFYNETYETE